MNFNKYSENIQGHIYIGHGLQITYVGQGLFIFCFICVCLFVCFFLDDHHHFIIPLKNASILKYLSKHVKLF